MRATKLTVAAGVVALAAAPIVMVQPGAVAADHTTNDAVAERSTDGDRAQKTRAHTTRRELEIIRQSKPRKFFLIRPRTARELEIIRSAPATKKVTIVTAGRS